jgi:integrase
MSDLGGLIWCTLIGLFRSRAALQAEILILRHQLNVLRRKSPKRVSFSNVDRLVFAALYRLAPGVLDALTILKPETVIRWHRAGFRAYWRWKSRPGGGRPKTSAEIRQLIRGMSIANPLWGAPRIHGELLKLGIDVGQTTVAKYMARRRRPPSQGWKTFLLNHADGIASMDMFVVPTISFRLLYGFLILRHSRREIVIGWCLSSVSSRAPHVGLWFWSPTPRTLGLRFRGRGCEARSATAGCCFAVVAEYFDSQQFFASKSAGTQRMRRGILERFRAAYGDWPFALLPAEWIEKLLDAKPPHAARSWLVTLRSLCQFAVKRGWLRADPTANIKLRAIKGDGFHTWTEDEIAQFEAHHPIGTKPRLALALLLYTAQRRSDVVRMGRQHIKDGVLTVKQQKTGSTLAIPLHPELRAVLDATPSEHLTVLVTATGKPYGGNAFSEQFRNWCDAAGLPKRCTAHGLRKAACRRMAEAQCTVHEIASISGHASLDEVARYTKAADQARLARNALAKAVIR